MTAAERRADVEWSRDVRAREGYRCQRCRRQGEPGVPPAAQTSIHAHHVFRRSISATRWDPGNGLALCRDCHAWAQAHPNESREVAAGLMGPNEYERLRALASGHVRRRDAVPARPPKSASRARPVEALSVEPF